jgi:hypothetical protein
MKTLIVLLFTLGLCATAGAYKDWTPVVNRDGDTVWINPL